MGTKVRRPPRGPGGGEVGVEDFRGRRVLLINWSLQCGYCDLMAPDLAKLQAGLKGA